MLAEPLAVTLEVIEVFEDRTLLDRGIVGLCFAWCCPCSTGY
jgi:hypothetical protein